MTKIILASASPRRKELLAIITKDFEVITADVDERTIEEEILKKHTDMKDAGTEMTIALGMAKAMAVFERSTSDEDVLVIGSDTCVVTRDEILGKPKDREDCVRMLTKLSKGPHFVITGVSLVSRSKATSFAVTSEVIFNDLDEIQKKFIEEYADSDEPYDKAGAYGIQGRGALLIKELKGDYFNVMGLPISELNRVLASF